LRDLSIGPAVLGRLREQDWPAGVEIEDWSVGPIAIVQRLEDEPRRYSRLVLVGAAVRDRPPGALACYRWDGALPGPDEIQRRIGEAVMGVIDLDQLLVVGGHFGAFPDDVRVIEIEPEDTGWGDGFTPSVAAALGDIVTAVRSAALDDEGSDG
jgi:hydrogenase maturation protease